MIKKISLVCCMLLIFSCKELQQVVNQLPESSGTGLNNEVIANGLKEALDQGIEKQVSKLTKADGFYKNELVKILLPDELKKVDKTLRDIGLGNLADEGLKVLNRAAEDAVSEATPIFVSAVKEMSFSDAKNILLGEKNAATTYLENKTNTTLYQKFNPIINSSFKKVGADKIWSTIINRYNAIPLTTNINPNLTDYVTQETLTGVYKMIAIEEEHIRTKLTSRTTDILRRVFALQD
ncbi:DUF4197 domain-containing protein [Maribacter sp. ACAM166]|uniref:DUF4197 domain-containing protein n=1 Tax=Maribacter sp. ACAM166 TaxID=2508996 RepID=UPI0010FE0A69|nr:DUF4197 domain-containing protein [Maribacter sp. ACAM166]TLP80456.1 DUF4197 domain-containing protein [Maribacter sp. ACAM166]